MPHFICRWPGGDVLLASVESRQELDAILQVSITPRYVQAPHAQSIVPLFSINWHFSAASGERLLGQLCLTLGWLYRFQERCEPGVCKVARYHGPLVLELKPDVPGVPRVSSEIFTPGPPCPAFKAAWDTHTSSGDIEVIARDGSSQRAHKLVLQCRLPALQGQPVAAHVAQVSRALVESATGVPSVAAAGRQHHIAPQLHSVMRLCMVTSLLPQ